MPIQFENHPIFGLRLTASSKDLLREIKQATELYYFLKFADFPDSPIELGISAAQNNAANLSPGSLVGYTPDPDNPYPRPWPFPWPGPFPWWHRNIIDQLIDIADGPVHNLGNALGDPSPQPSIAENIRSTQFHLKAASEALEKMDKARDQLKRNIAKLQKMK